MRRFKKLLAVGACLCMSLSLLAGCGSGSGNASGSGSSDSGTKQESTKSSDLSFAFCTNTLNNTFQSSIDAKLKELCDANGISYTCLDPDYDLNTQLSQLSDVANSGYDAVFIIPVDSAGITSGLAEIKDAGIPIFNVDTAVIEDDIENFVTQFVGTNAYMAGQLVGEQMAKDYPDVADIAILDFPSNESCVDRVNGFLDVVEKLDGVEVVADQDAWVQDDAVSVVSDILTANPDVNLIYAANEGGTVGATMAVKNVGKAGSVYTFGIDANEQLANMLLSDDNILQATTGQDSYTMGYNSMKDLISSIKGEETSIEEGTTEYVDGMLLERSDEDGINDYLERLSELSK